MDLRWHWNRLLVAIAARCLKATGWFEGYWSSWRGQPFESLERQGLHVLPVHYYTPIPLVSAIPSSVYDKVSQLPGIELGLDTALARLQKLAARHRDEYNAFPFEQSHGKRAFHLANTAYGPGDAEILYAMVRDLRPRRIIEVGAGYTTLLISEALRRNQQDGSSPRTEFVSIEPYPPDYLTPLPAELDRMIATGLQDVPLSTFESLGEGDLLFIDSSHVVKIGSDVIYEVLEILPRLAPGVIVHIHDIFLPREYPRGWLEESRFFWNEQYLLQAFLSGNDGFEVILPSNALFHEHRRVFDGLIPSCTEHGRVPSSFWLRSRARR